LKKNKGKKLQGGKNGENGEKMKIGPLITFSIIFYEDSEGIFLKQLF
jgi:hypothetical protein